MTAPCTFIHSLVVTAVLFVTNQVKDVGSGCIKLTSLIPGFPRLKMPVLLTHQYSSLELMKDRFDYSSTNPYPLWKKKKEKKASLCSLSFIFIYLQLEPRILKEKKKLKEIIFQTYVPVNEIE